MNRDNATPDPRKQDAHSTSVRRLTPDNANVFEGTYSLLHCRVREDELYRGVFCVLMFPVSHPRHFISLRYTDEKDKVREVGIIEDLRVFSEEQQRLIRTSLDRHYYEQRITRINKITNEFGVLAFDVETDRGRRQFMMPWRIDRAEDYGSEGKVLLDALDNRYIIPNVSDLPSADARRFTSYIYW
jgi:hypothetical protein